MDANTGAVAGVRAVAKDAVVARCGVRLVVVDALSRLAHVVGARITIVGTDSSLVDWLTIHTAEAVIFASWPPLADTVLAPVILCQRVAIVARRAVGIVTVGASIGVFGRKRTGINGAGVSVVTRFSRLPCIVRAKPVLGAIAGFHAIDARLAAARRAESALRARLQRSPGTKRIAFFTVAGVGALDLPRLAEIGIRRTAAGVGARSPSPHHLARDNLSPGFVLTLKNKGNLIDQYIDLSRMKDCRQIIAGIGRDGLPSGRTVQREVDILRMRAIPKDHRERTKVLNMKPVVNAVAVIVSLTEIERIGFHNNSAVGDFARDGQVKRPAFLQAGRSPVYRDGASVLSG